MPVFTLLLILGLLLADQSPHGLGVWWVDLPGWSMAATVLLPKLAIALLMIGASRWTVRQLNQARPMAISRHGRVRQMLRLMLLLSFAVDLGIGWLGAVRQMVGNWILIDELLTLAPTLVVMLFIWWCEYPMDRRMREASLISRLDAGRPIGVIWTRGQYVLHQARHQLAIALVPGGLFLAWWDVVGRVWPPSAELVPGVPAHSAAALAGAGVVAVLTPPLLRRVWSTQALPAGELRDRLLAMCCEHRVGVRQILLWRTYGGLVNAAVMGVLRPVRYVLLTDALLESLPRRQVEAVMAHELAHIRRHHIPWMMLLLLSAGALLTWAGDQATPMLGDVLPATIVDRHGWVIEAVLALLAGAVWIVFFGCVSRQFERQADAFAVVHLSRHDDAPRDAPQCVTAQAVRDMSVALAQVAVLNCMDTRRRAFRHGSIASRLAAMRTLVGRPLDDLPVNRAVARLQLAGLGMLLLAGLLAAWRPTPWW